MSTYNCTYIFTEVTLKKKKILSHFTIPSSIFVNRLKSSLPRKERVLCDDESFEGQQSPFSETNNTQEIINNTITELNPHNNINNQTDADLSNLTETPLSGSLGDKSSIDLFTQNTGMYDQRYIILLYLQRYK